VAGSQSGGVCRYDTVVSTVDSAVHSTAQCVNVVSVLLLLRSMLMHTTVLAIQKFLCC